MIIGFTGTQKGMTEKQKKSVLELLLNFSPKEVHHGDCIGADFDFDKSARIIKAEIHIHPPDIDKKRAFCKPDKLYPKKPFLMRNQDIVNKSDMLFATPNNFKELQRSGTWSTIRKARKKGITIYIIYPNGNILRLKEDKIIYYNSNFYKEGKNMFTDFVTCLNAKLKEKGSNLMIREKREETDYNIHITTFEIVLNDPFSHTSFAQPDDSFYELLEKESKRFYSKKIHYNNTARTFWFI
jgi:hypothetical protein